MRARVPVFVTCAAAILSASCGGSSSGAAAPPPAAPEPNGSPTTAEPSPPPSPAPPPAPSPSPQPDRFATIERLDSDPSCDALVPSSVPDPVTFQADPKPSGVEIRACGDALSDGRGDVAAQVMLHLSNGHNEAIWQAFRPDGSAGQLMARTADDPMFALPDGWQGPEGMQGAIEGAAVITYFGDGAVRHTTPGTPTSGFSERGFSAAPDPQGGSLLVQIGAPAAGSDTCADARRIDPLGNAGTPASLPGLACFVSAFAAGVSTAGESLVLSQSGKDLTVRWIRADGQRAVPDATEAGAAFVLSPGGGKIRLYPLLDGSLAVFSGSFWSSRYAHLADHGDSPPPWLQARPAARFRFTRGNRGYAFFPPPDQVSSDCSQVAEIVAPDGRNCARIIFHEPGAADCKTGFLDQGWDGTLVRQAASGSCTWRAWPGFLAGP